MGSLDGKLSMQRELEVSAHKHSLCMTEIAHERAFESSQTSSSMLFLSEFRELLTLVTL